MKLTVGLLKGLFAHLDESMTIEIIGGHPTGEKVYPFGLRPTTKGLFFAFGGEEKGSIVGDVTLRKLSFSLGVEDDSEKILFVSEDDTYYSLESFEVSSDKVSFVIEEL